MSQKNQIWHIRAEIPKYFLARRADAEKHMKRAQGWYTGLEIPETGWKIEMSDMSQNRQPQRDQGTRTRMRTEDRNTILGETQTS